MAERIISMRALLRQNLEALGSPHRWGAAGSLKGSAWVNGREPLRCCRGCPGCSCTARPRCFQCCAKGAPACWRPAAAPAAPAAAAGTAAAVA